MKYLFPIFIFLFKISFSQQFNHTFLGTSEGLPSSEVYDILQDKAGYMWFATNLGVSRYNGKQFFTYTTANGLIDNTIFRMCEDRDGRIWFGSQSNEICYWQNGIIQKSPISDVFHKQVRPFEIIKGLYADSTGRIWVNTIKRTFIFTQKNGRVEFEEIKDPEFIQQHLIAVENKVMFTLSRLPTNKNINSSQLNFKFHSLGEPPQYASIFDTKGTIQPIMFVTYAVNRKKPSFYFCTNNAFYTIEKGKPVQRKVFPHSIVSLTIDHHNDLWIGYYKQGVACYKNCDLNSVPLKLPGDYSVDDVCVDHEGGVWLATLEKGVVYIPSTSILVYRDNPLLNDHITLMTTVHQQLYIYTFGGTLFKEQNLKVSVDDFIGPMLKKKSGLYYLVTIRDTTYLSFGDRLVRLGASFETLPTKRTVLRPEFASGKYIFETEDHSIWMFYGGGLKKIRNQQEDAIIYDSPQRSTCAVPVGNTILVGGKKGVYLFKDKKYLHLGYLDTLLKSSITDVVKTQDGSIWFTTIGNGLLRFKNDKVQQLLQKDGLVSNTCTAVTVDDENRIWVGSNNGISYVEPSTKEPLTWKIKNITQQNGLNSNEITKLFTTGDSLWVGTMSGLSWVHISGIIKPLAPSPVHISGMKVNNQTIGFDKNIFPYDENNMRFSLHGLTYKDNGNHRYRYRLNGLDTSWQETNFDELLFNNLDPGNYRFEVQVANLDNVWSKEVTSFAFTISKPFWLTWWFIVLEILLLVAIVYLIILWRTYIIRKKEAEKLRINKLLAEYQMKALTAQMNPHFIFNAINSIQNFIIQNHSTLAYDYLIKFSKLIRLVLNNSNEKEITLQQELDTLAIYIELEQLRFKDSFEYIVEVDAELETDSLMLPSLLLQPYIENAIWHGLMPLKTHKGVIRLSIKKQDEFLNIRITDNGIGRKASDQLKKKVKHSSHKSIGMELTGKRIEIFGQDHSFSIHILDNYDELNNPIGTTVEIILPIVEMY